MRNRRKMLCLFLTLVMAFTFIPTMSFADNEDSADAKNASYYYTGTKVSRTIEANAVASYTMNDGFNGPCQVYLETTKTSGSVSFTVCDKNGNVRKELTTDEVYQQSSVGSIEEPVVSVPSGLSVVAFYWLEDGDRIEISADNAAADYTLYIQKIVSPTDYQYGEFSYMYLFDQAMLIPIDIQEDYQKNAVIYLENAAAMKFAYYVVNGDGDLLKDTDGKQAGQVKIDEFVNKGYNLDPNENNYLFIFVRPNYGDVYYSGDESPFDASEDDYEIAFAVTPQDLKYYDVTGIKDQTYNGKNLETTFDVEYNKVLLGTDDYSVSYSNNRNVGMATVTLQGVHPQTGTVKKTFKINPKGTSLSKVKPAKKGFTVKWKKQKAKMSKARITGYQIQYSTSSSFKSGNKTVTVKGYNKKSKKIKKLKAKKKYYVRVRTYMKVSGKTYCSPWSNAKKVKTR